MNVLSNEAMSLQLMSAFLCHAAIRICARSNPRTRSGTPMSKNNIGPAFPGLKLPRPIISRMCTKAAPNRNTERLIAGATQNQPRSQIDKIPELRYRATQILARSGKGYPFATLCRLRYDLVRECAVSKSRQHQNPHSTQRK